MKKFFAILFVVFSLISASAQSLSDYTEVGFDNTYSYLQPNDYNINTINISSIKVPTSLYEHYIIGNNCFKSGCVFIAAGGLLSVVGAICYAANDYRAGNALVGIGGTFIGVSIPLMCFGDHIKRESDVMFDTWMLQTSNIEVKKESNLYKYDTNETDFDFNVEEDYPLPIVNKFYPKLTDNTIVLNESYIAVFEHPIHNEVDNDDFHLTFKKDKGNVSITFEGKFQNNKFIYTNGIFDIDGKVFENNDVINVLRDIKPNSIIRAKYIDNGNTVIEQQFILTEESYFSIIGFLMD